jgi:hypothetical protein
MNMKPATILIKSIISSLITNQQIVSNEPWVFDSKTQETSVRIQILGHKFIITVKEDK